MKACGRSLRSPFDLQASLYILAVGPPRSEIMPVKPGVLSRMASTSRHNRVFRTALDDAALMFGNGAEGAAAETAAHDIH